METGQPVASWRGSGLGCGYQWIWLRDTVVFIEGSLVTWWSPETKAKTYESDCVGAETPILSPDGALLIALDGVWSTSERRRISQLEMKSGAAVAGFSHDQKLVLGSTRRGEELDEPSRVAWDATTGRIVWHHRPLRIERRHDGVQPSHRIFGATFVNERTGATYGEGVVVQKERGAERIVFNDECWAGPSELPAEEVQGFPRHECPELLDEFDALVRSGAFRVF